MEHKIGHFPESCPNCHIGTTWSENGAEKEKSYQEGLEKALEVLEGRKEHAEDCINRQDGYGYKFRDYDPHCQANGYNQALSEAKKKIKELIDQK